jgi:hypothetical protein
LLGNKRPFELELEFFSHFWSITTTKNRPKGEPLWLSGKVVKKEKIN